MSAPAPLPTLRSPESAPFLLEARHIECVRNEVVIFRRVAFRLQEGALLHISGPNGSGKTSLLRIVSGLLLPSQGGVCWRGEDIQRGRRDFLRELGYLGHVPGLKKELSCMENLRLALLLDGARPKVGAGEALARVGLAGRGRTRVAALSAGQRQRLALARLLATDTLLWLLDEPFTCLDQDGSAMAGGLITDHCLAGGLVVLVSHQPVSFGRVPVTRLCL